MSVTAYPTLRMKLTLPTALKLQFLPAIPGSNAAAAAAEAVAAAAEATAAADAAVAATASKVDRSGDVMTGFLTLNADPTAGLHAASKQYVDAHSGGGGGGAPVDAEYITSTADATLTNERVLTDTASVAWDRTTPGQIKANTTVGGGNVSNSGTPTAGQYGKWVTATTIQGVAPATVLSDIGAAPLASPIFTGTPSLPTGTVGVTQTAGDNDTSIATTAFVTAAVAAGGGSASPSPPQGRLTLQTATPVMTTTQAAKTSIFYTPYLGNRICLYNGTTMTMATFAELSNVTTASSANKAGPAAVVANSLFDLFVWDDAGTVRLTRGPAWTNDTARSAGTALIRVSGINLNNAAITNGPAAQRGTYVGTMRSNASSQLDWIYGTTVANGGAAVLGVWNAYNRVDVSTMVGDQTSFWTYASTAWRQLHGTTGNQVEFVSGLAEDAMNCQYNGLAASGSPGSYVQGIGLDVFTAFVGTTAHSAVVNNAPYIATYSGMHLGWHVVAPIEQVVNGGTSTVLGGGAAVTQQGFNFEFKM